MTEMQKTIQNANLHPKSAYLSIFNEVLKVSSCRRYKETQAFLFCLMHFGSFDELKLSGVVSASFHQITIYTLTLHRHHSESHHP